MTEEQLNLGIELSRQISLLEENLKNYAKPTQTVKRQDPEPGDPLIVYTTLYANFIDMDTYRARATKHLSALKKKLAGL